MDLFHRRRLGFDVSCPKAFHPLCFLGRSEKRQRDPAPMVLRGSATPIALGGCFKAGTEPS